MKTAKERARILLDALEMYKDVSRDLKIKAIEKAIKEQDRDTRHAAIEDINMLYAAIHNDAIDCDTVTSVIMNVKAV